MFIGFELVVSRHRQIVAGGYAPIHMKESFLAACQSCNYGARSPKG